MYNGSVAFGLLVGAFVSGGPVVAADSVQLGPRPFYLVERMSEGPLKDKLKACTAGPFSRSSWSIGHRGAPLQFPEHTKESYEAAIVMGAGVVECDVTFTKDRELVCRHAQCDLHTTTDILARPDLAAKCTQAFTPADPASGKPASAKCCTSDLTLAEFKTLHGKMDAADKTATTVEAYMNATPRWRTDLYASRGTLMTHAESIALLKSHGVKFTPELKAPEVPMPFDGDFTQEAYAQKMIDAYKTAGVPGSDVFAQSFNLADIEYWIANAPDFAATAVFLDGRDETDGLDPMKPETWKPTMAELAAKGVKILAPPLWYLLTLDENKQMVPSAYAKAAKEAGLELITWSFERAGTLTDGGGWYYQSVEDAITKDADMMVALDALAQKVGVRAIFSDWPATTTFYANCMGLK